MKKNFIRAAFVVALLSSTAAMAQMGGGMTSTPPKSAAKPSAGENKVGKAVGVPLVAAQKAIQAQDYASALIAVQQAQAIPDQTPYETYVINKFLSIVDIDLKDMAGAAVAAEAAADSPALPEEDKKDVLHNGFVLAVQGKQYQKAIGYAQQLEASNLLDADMTAMTADAYYYLKDMANAQQYAQKAIDRAKAEGKEPNGDALRLVMNAQAKSDPAAAIHTLEQLAVNSNDPMAWSDLVNNALGTKGMRPVDQLYLFRLLYQAGAMASADDFTALGSLSEQQGYPTEAHAVLQQGITSGKITSGQAGANFAKSRSDAATDERMLPSIAAAAEKSKTGEQDAKLAEDYWGYGRYADVETAAQGAVSKGGVKDPTEAIMLLGMAQTAQGKYDEAQANFAKVSGSEARSKVAHLWSLYAKAKQNRASGATPPAGSPAH
jgi:hypothetical protein